MFRKLADWFWATDNPWKNEDYQTWIQEQVDSYDHTQPCSGIMTYSKEEIEEFNKRRYE